MGMDRPQFRMFSARSLAAVWIALLAFTVLAAPRAIAQTHKILFETSFEAEEGYSIDDDLVGQKGWLGEGTGGSGLVPELFEGMGQQAYIGFSPPEAGTSLFSILQPVNYRPVQEGISVVKFSVWMKIVPSDNGRADDFRWTIYNAEGSPLFSLDFEGATRVISSISDTGAIEAAGFEFDYNEPYELVIWMNFKRGLWTAVMNGVVIINSKPMTTTSLGLTLGDVDAVWSVLQPNSAGNNYMVFDDYRLTAELGASIPPVIEAQGFDNEGAFLFYVLGETGLQYAVEATTDFVTWEPVGVFRAPDGGIIDLSDSAAANFPHSFYRAREVQ